MVLAVCAGLGLLGAGTGASAAELSGNAALTTDYVFRGITQTQGDPAAQIGVKLAGDSGVYGAVWGFKAPFELRVTAHGTDSTAKRLFPGLAGSRVEAALQASF